MRAIIAFLFLCFCVPAHGYGSMPCPSAQPSDIALILAGQSNNGSYGDVGYQPQLSGTPGGDIQIWWGTGDCYPLNDGLAGFPANSGSGGGGAGSAPPSGNGTGGAGCNGVIVVAYPN